MRAFTLDTNCIIAVDEERPEAAVIRALAAAHNEGLALVGLVAISASERQKDGGTLENFGTFKERLQRLGLERLELLEPMLYMDISFWDFCLWAEEEDEALESKIHGILFPSMPFKWSDFCDDRGVDPNSGTIDRKWLNAKCDVQAFWSHMHHEREVFVTSDQNFHAETKKRELLALAGGRIEYPIGAAALLP